MKCPESAASYICKVVQLRYNLGYVFRDFQEALFHIAVVSINLDSSGL